MRLFSRMQVAIRNVKPSGFKADVVVFDAKTVKAPATGTQPKQFPDAAERPGLDGKAVKRLEQHVIRGRGSIAV